MSLNKPKQAGLPLYTSAFSMALSLSMWWTAMPFILRGLGGTEEHVGLAPALHMAGYLVFLLLAYHVHHLGYKRAICCSLGIISGATLVIGLAAGGITEQPFASHLGRIWIIIGAGAVAGGALAFFWPYLMDWTARGFAAHALNRRLGYYNASWSSAVVIGPILGASLVETHLMIPVLVPSALLLICMLLLLPLKVQSQSSSPIEVQPEAPLRNPGQDEYAGLYRVARIALFSGWFAAAILRSQFALLMTDLGFTRSQFGMFIAIIAVTNLTVLWLAGRWVSWHGRLLPLLLTQVLGVLSMLLFIRGRSMAAFSLGAILHGGGWGFAYSAHLYYGAVGPHSRSKAMVMHELTIAMSTVIGAALGGYVSRFGGEYWPYWLCLWLACLSLIAQTGIWGQTIGKTWASNSYS